jgi:hypothetical protein
MLGWTSRLRRFQLIGEPPVSGEATVEVAQVLARLKVAEEHAATGDPSLVPGLVRAQAIVRELEGWPVEEDARIT